MSGSRANQTTERARCLLGARERAEYAASSGDQLQPEDTLEDLGVDDVLDEGISPPRSSPTTSSTRGRRVAGAASRRRGARGAGPEREAAVPRPPRTDRHRPDTSVTRRQQPALATGRPGRVLTMRRRLRGPRVSGGGRHAGAGEWLAWIPRRRWDTYSGSLAPARGRTTPRSSRALPCRCCSTLGDAESALLVRRTGEGLTVVGEQASALDDGAGRRGGGAGAARSTGRLPGAPSLAGARASARVSAQRLPGHVGVLAAGLGIRRGRRRTGPRAGPLPRRRRAGPHPGRGRPGRPRRPRRQRPAPRQHGRLRLAHRLRHQPVVRPAVPDLRPRAAGVQPLLRQVPRADPPRRPRADLGAAPARLRAPASPTR